MRKRDYNHDFYPVHKFFPHAHRAGASVLGRFVTRSQGNHLLSQPALAQIALYFYPVKPSSLWDIVANCRTGKEDLFAAEVVCLGISHASSQHFLLADGQQDYQK